MRRLFLDKGLVQKLIVINGSQVRVELRPEAVGQGQEGEAGNRGRDTNQTGYGQPAAAGSRGGVRVLYQFKHTRRHQPFGALLGGGAGAHQCR